MEDPKETLRKILCDDEELNDAAEILERLIELDDKSIANWHSESAVIEHDSEYQADLLRKLKDGGLVNRALFGFEPSYCIIKEGRDLYTKYKSEFRDY
ncbi:MAG: hypothetical protein AABY07_03875 [Nanoarchaeota archaeon]